MKTLRLSSVFATILIALAIILVGLHASRSAASSSTASLARQQALPPPHLGYGLNVWDRPQLAAGLGFDWLKLFEEAGPPPATRLPYKILYRVFVNGYPASLSTYLQHIHDLVQAGRGKVEAYEIGNEPNLGGDGFWGNQGVNPEAYAELVCAIYPVIKSEDPQALVISAGLAPVGPWGPEYWGYVMDETVFAQRMLTHMRAVNNGQFCIDGFGYHPHGFAFTPETDYHDAPNGFAFRSAERMHDVMVAAGATHMQMWATEFGWIRYPSSDPYTDANGHVSSYSWCSGQQEMSGFLWMLVTEQQQADYLVRAFQYADANWPWMGPMFIWNLDFFYRGTLCTPQRFYSLFHATEGDPNLLSPTLAYIELAAMPKRLAGMPLLAVRPEQLLFLGEIATPTVQTQTLNLINLTPDITSTWTITISPSAELQPVVGGALTGTNNATLTVSVDTQSITTTGVYTAYLLITTEPGNAPGVPISVPVSVIAVNQLQHTYLPLLSNNDTAPVVPDTTTYHLGLAFVSSAEAPAGDMRYQRAADIGGKIDRWPMYWPQIEKDPIGQPRVFDWSSQDANVIADLKHGFTILPILMLTPPGFFTTTTSLEKGLPQVGQGWKLQLQQKPLSPSAPCPSDQTGPAANPPPGLIEPVFDDQSDIPGPTKFINSANRWAVFVNTAVNRYKPGGVLAQQQGWGNDQGVHDWEIWNEEDLCYFFNGTPADYARLLKVAYLAARQADPNAMIVFGGQAHFQQPAWLDNVLDVIASDPLSTTYHGFMDAVATHNYFWSWQTFGYLFTDRERLNTHGLSAVKSWITESGVVICGDPPGPACDDPGGRWYRASPSEQADFLIQSIAYAAWLKAEDYFWFQLFDDCGNACGVDAYGLVRNDNTPRPAYTTYSMTNNLLSHAQPYWRQRQPSWTDPRMEVIAFQQPDAGKRIVVMWNRYYTATETAVLTATAASAQLVFPDGTLQTIYPISDTYSIPLPPATNRNFLGTTGGIAPDGSAPIGGSPRILVENDPAVQP